MGEQLHWFQRALDQAFKVAEQMAEGWGTIIYESWVVRVVQLVYWIQLLDVRMAFPTGCWPCNAGSHHAVHYTASETDEYRAVTFGMCNSLVSSRLISVSKTQQSGRYGLSGLCLAHGPHLYHLSPKTFIEIPRKRLLSGTTSVSKGCKIIL